MTAPYPTGVLPKYHVQAPVQPVLYRPVAPNTLVKLKRAHIRTADIVPVTHLPVTPTAVLNDSFQVFPGSLVIKPFNIGYASYFPLFNPPVLSLFLAEPNVIR